MTITHKIRLWPNNRQATYLSRCCGVARFAYNWGLAKWNEQYEAHKADPDNAPQPNQYSLRKELNAIKHSDFPWMSEVTKYAPQQALINLGKAFGGFFKAKREGRAVPIIRNGKPTGRLKYEPQFKCKGKHDCFYIGSDQIAVDGDMVKIPGLARFMGGRNELGRVRMAEHLRYDGAKIMCAVVSRTADKWFIAITCEVPGAPQGHDQEKIGVVGIDIGVGEYVTSDGEYHAVPRAYRRAMRQLKRAQQSLCRKVKGSRNRWRQKQRIARIHARIANVRGDWLHKLSSGITKKYKTVVLEDLNVKGMSKNRHLAVSVTDAAFGEFRRQIEYKSKLNGCEVVFADRWFPSSKTCSQCGKVKAKLSLSERTFRCDGCGFVCHRDLNAALNLKNLAASSAVTACGEFSASAPGPSRIASSLNEAGRKRHSKPWARIG